MGLKGLTALIAASGLTMGQSSGSVTGQLTDQTGAAIPGVKITVTAPGTGARQMTVTNPTGNYTVPSLAPGDYVVTAELEGFKKASSKAVRVGTGNATQVNIVMVPEDAKQVVEVNADPPAIETQISMVSNTVTQAEIESMPLSTRNVLDLAMTIPGITGDPGSDEGGIFLDVPASGSGLNISGGRAGSSAILADGANSTSLGIGRATATFSPDTIQEMNIITSTFSAKYGQSGGGVVQTVTRAGTDRYRGTAYWYHRNPALAARQFNRPIQPQSRRQEVGVTYSGPVWIPKIYKGKGKTWFFVAVEPKRWFDQIDIYDRVPTLEERNGDFRNTWVPPGQTRPRLHQQVLCSPSPTNCQQLRPVHRPASTAQYPLFSASDPDPTKRGFVIPKNMFDPLSVKILEEIPLPNQRYDSLGRNYFGTRGVDGRSNRLLAKVDHYISQKNRLSFNYRDIPNFSDRFRLSKENLFFSFASDQSLTRQVILNDTWTISPSVVNEVRASYTFLDSSRTPPGDLATRNYTEEKFGLPSAVPWGYPQFSTGFIVYGLNNGGEFGLGQYIEHSYQLADDLSIIRGRHTLQVGGDYRLGMMHAKSSGLSFMCCGTYAFNASQTNSGNANTPGGTGGHAFAGFLLGVPNAITLRNILIPYYYRFANAAGYFQDDFKVRPNLTLNLGVRWQFNSPRWEKWNRQASFDFDTPTERLDAQGQLIGFSFDYLYAGYQGRSKFLEKAHYKNFEPRFGFAWQPGLAFFKRHHMVLRGGYGVSHPPVSARGRDPIPVFGNASAGAWGFLRWQSNTAVPARTQSKDPNYVISVGRNPPVTQLNPITVDIPKEGKLCVGCTNALDPRIPAGARVMFSREARSQYIQTWNMTTQFELPGAIVGTLTYMGQKGTHLLSPLIGINNPDPVAYGDLLDEGLDPTELIEDEFGRVDAQGNPLLRPRVDYLRPNPLAGDVSLAGLTDANSIYHAGTMSFDRRMRGVQFRANYTWAKSIDTSSDASLNAPTLYPWSNTRIQNAYDLKGNRSVSNFDVRHRLNFQLINVDLPFGRRKALFGNAGRKTNFFVGDWAVSGNFFIQTGFPWQIYLGNADSNGVPGGATGNEKVRPDMVLGVPLRNPRWTKGDANDTPLLNPEAFSRPAYGQIGNAPRTLDYFRTPMRFSSNLSLLKEIRPWRERNRYFQLRGEAYNLTNTVIFNIGAGGTSEALFSSAPPVCRTCTNLGGAMPYLYSVGSGTFPLGSREQLLAASYNQNFGKLWRDRNGPGRVIQLALRFYF